MPQADDAALRQAFLDARTQNAWLPQDVPDSLLQQSIDTVKMGPTSANCSPARFVFVKSKAEKEQLKPHLSEGNRDKTMQAPVCAIIGYDLEFYEHLPKLFPHTDARSWFAGKPKKIRRHGLPQRHSAGRLSDHRGAALGIGLRADVRLRQRRRRRGVFRRHRDQIEFPLQSRLWRSIRRQSAPAAVHFRRNGENHLTFGVQYSDGESAVLCV